MEIVHFCVLMHYYLFVTKEHNHAWGKEFSVFIRVRQAAMMGGREAHRYSERERHQRSTSLY